MQRARESGPQVGQGEVFPIRDITPFGQKDSTAGFPKKEPGCVCMECIRNP